MMMMMYGSPDYFFGGATCSAKSRVGRQEFIRVSQRCHIIMRTSVCTVIIVMMLHDQSSGKSLICWGSRYLQSGGKGDAVVVVTY